MSFFNDFTAPIREIFIGHLLLFACSLFYLRWWVVAFRPNSTGLSSQGGLYLLIASIAGLAAIAFTIYGISALAPQSEGLSIMSILIGVGALFFILLVTTSVIFHRPITSELMLILSWTALELSAVNVLRGIGRFNTVKSVTLAGLIGIATVVGLICYMLYYRLDESAAYYSGMVPLITDAFVTLVFIGALAI